MYLKFLDHRIRKASHRDSKLGLSGRYYTYFSLEHIYIKSPKNVYIYVLDGT